MRAVEPLDVWRAIIVVEGPEPRVMEAPGESVWPEMMYWDCAFGVMVEEPMVRGWGSVFEGGERREVWGP